MNCVSRDNNKKHTERVSDPWSAKRPFEKLSISGQKCQLIFDASCFIIRYPLHTHAKRVQDLGIRVYPPNVCI